MDKVFASQLDWAKPRGLYLNERLERKSVNGLYGMYATAPIEANSLLASFPEKNLLKAGGKDFKGDSEQFWLNWIKVAAKERSKSDSEYLGIFAGFESLEDMREYSSYFCSDEELETVRSMSPVLHRWIVNANSKADYVLTKLQESNPEFASDEVLAIYLNVRSRGFHPQGVVPALDQFNHSDVLGQTSVTEKGNLCFYSKQAYKAGEQVFISYGPKDLYKHAIHYNYFDPTGPHLIEFGRKSIQSAEGPVGEKLLRHLKKHFKVKELNNNGQRAYMVSDSSVMLTEYGLSDGLVSFLKESCRCRLPANVSEQELMHHATQYFVYLINQQLKMIRVQNVDPNRITPRLKRFYDLLVREQQILALNRKRVAGV